MPLLPAVEALAKTGGSRSQELAVTLTRSLAGPDVRVEGGKPLDGTLRMDLARLAEAHGLARLTWGEETVALRAQPEVQLGRTRDNTAAGRLPASQPRQAKRRCWRR